MGSLGQVQGLGQGLWFNEGDQRSGVGVTGGGGDSGGEGTAGGGEGRRVNLIKAKPRPLAPFLIFQNHGGGVGGGSCGVGSGRYGASHLVCALGTSTGLLDTAVLPALSNIPVKMTEPSLISSQNDRAQSTSYSTSYSLMESLGGKSGLGLGLGAGLGNDSRQQPSPFSSPTSITNSLRFMSPHHPAHQRDPITTTPTATSTFTTTTATATTTVSSSSRVGLAHAMPRTSILLGGSLFEGLKNPVKITAPSQTSQSK